MDETGGILGLLAVILVVALIVVAWRSLGGPPEPDAGIAPVPRVARADPNDDESDDVIADVARSVPMAGEPQDADNNPREWWPFGRPATLGIVGALYVGGLFLVRPRAIRAKRNGATDQQAALIALIHFAFSPIIVPFVATWRGLGALGRALTSEPVPSPGAERKGRGASDLD